MTPAPDGSIQWNLHGCESGPLNLGVTLASGQSFRWRQDAQSIWWGVVEETVIATWQADGEPDSPLYWQTFPEPDRWDLVSDYFRLNVDLEALYARWVEAEPRIGPAIQAFRGLRLLRQPPHECFFAFQCAVCNTVVKIERSVAHLARHYGQRIVSVSGLPFEFHAFPTLEALAEADESVLRAGLWGYRAPRVIALARRLQETPEWLASLRYVPYREAHTALMTLHGVGAKLADCICLFALDKDEASPVDTHVRKIAVKLFAPELAAKTLTPRIYEALAETFRSRFGDTAGWAQQYLFFAELRRAKEFMGGAL